MTPPGSSANDNGNDGNTNSTSGDGRLSMSSLTIEQTLQLSAVRERWEKEIDDARKMKGAMKQTLERVSGVSSLYKKTIEELRSTQQLLADRTKRFQDTEATLEEERRQRKREQRARAMAVQTVANLTMQVSQDWNGYFYFLSYHAAMDPCFS